LIAPVPETVWDHKPENLKELHEMQQLGQAEEVDFGPANGEPAENGSNREAFEIEKASSGWT
jgi:hypothetical protein